jgi:hypothetical protein
MQVVINLLNMEKNICGGLTSKEWKKYNKKVKEPPDV